MMSHWWYVVNASAIFWILYAKITKQKYNLQCNRHAVDSFGKFHKIHSLTDDSHEFSTLKARANTYITATKVDEFQTIFLLQHTLGIWQKWPIFARPDTTWEKLEKCLRSNYLWYLMANVASFLEICEI